MNIVWVRRIAQVFFLALCLWFCVVATVGDRWWQLRGWPVNWLLQLDPLVALGTMLTTGTLYAGLIWSLATIALTMLFGRFFCGWLCPFGTLHQAIGWLGRRSRKHAERVAANQYRPAQAIKYYILTFLFSAAAGTLLGRLLHVAHVHPVGSLVLLGIAAAVVAVRIRSFTAIIICAGILLGILVRPEFLSGSLQTGWLDPIPLVHRSLNLFVLSAFEGPAAARFSVAAASITALFLGALLMNLWIPRFYCRFLCPLGALFGLLVRWTPWRIGKRHGECNECELCENNCEGACDPFGKIRINECLLCMNCLRACRQAQMVYGPDRSRAGEIDRTGVTRRGFIASTIAGLGAIPAVRLAGGLDQNWNSSVVRPPGALPERAFLDRCIKCGQCMRACPTNVIQPALAEAGLEGFWTPVLNFRIGSSGCQMLCIACGQVCPTAALRPLTLDEKLGRGEFASAGPIRMGTAFVDRGRCLPWAMDVPCIVCQENCPVSPKAIFVREEFQIIRDGVREVESSTPSTVTVAGPALPPARLGSGDYALSVHNAPAGERRRIVETAGNRIVLPESAPFAEPPAPGTRVNIEVRLQKPQVDPDRCIGCGICQHECPVSGLRAIRVTAENESRSPRHSLTPRT
ncbi:MAG: 4Fe-4S binding protein [Verrucomicrobiota bacterium]